jgi:tetratricopeptide (TPR) repeat protein
LTEHEGRYQLAGDVAELAIPATLQDSLMARLDRLSVAKPMAQVASALGREFPYWLLAAVAEVDEPTLRQGLARLVEAELLFQRGVAPSATYTFKHALIQDTAYESLLRSARDRLHGRIAAVLETEFPERAAAAPELVAHHYDRAGRVTEALSYYQRAADAAQARFSNLEAIAHLERGVELTRSLPEGAERDDPELRLQVSLGVAHAAAHGFASEDTGRAWERARELCKGAGSPVQLAAALAGLAHFHQSVSELDAAMQFSEQLLVLARRTKDESYVLAGTYRVGVVTFYQGRFRECLEDLNAVLTLYDQKGPKGSGIYASNYGVDACAYSSNALWLLGYPDQAIARAAEGVGRARTLAHPLSLANALLFASICHSQRGEWKAAAKLAEECAEESERRGLAQFMGLSGIPRAYAIAQSQGRDTLAEAMEGLRGSAGTGQRTGVPFLLSLVARIHQELGREADALGAVESALAASEQGRQPFYDAELLQLKGELSLSSDEAEAETLFRRALEVAQSQEAKSLELRDATCLARLWQRQGKRDEARALLAPVYDWFTEGFDTRDLKDAKALLEELGA